MRGNVNSFIAFSALLVLWRGFNERGLTLPFKWRQTSVICMPPHPPSCKKAFTRDAAVPCIREHKIFHQVCQLKLDNCPFKTCWNLLLRTLRSRDAFTVLPLATRDCDVIQLLLVTFWGDFTGCNVDADLFTNGQLPIKSGEVVMVHLSLAGDRLILANKIIT